MIRAHCGKLLLSLALSLIFASYLYPRPGAKVNQGQSIDANRLANEVVQNELRAQIQDQSLWEYRERETEDGKTDFYDVVQTRSGEIQRLIAVNGVRLTGRAAAKENQRIQGILANRSQWEKTQKNRSEDADQERQLLSMLPAAFRFNYDGKRGDLIRLSFRPNPNFNPGNREATVFHHMNGFLWVDARQKRLAEIDGRLATEVKFFFGLLGHLDAGGTFSVKQADVGGGHWEMTLLDVNMNGKALFFKTIAVREKEVYTDFRPVSSSISLKEAAELLQKNPTS